MRQLKQDTNKVYELVAEAYALVKPRFKPKSQAAAVIQPAEETGRLDEPNNPEIINLFLMYTEHFNKIDQISAYLVLKQR
jgi:hypothetical protein